MINSACLTPTLSNRFSRINWDLHKQFILLGNLASILPVLPDTLSKSSLMKLGLITARPKGSKRKSKPPFSLHVYLALSASDTVTQTDVSGSDLAKFYGHFFKSGVQVERNLKCFLGQLATVMVLRHVYYKPDCFCMEIVGSLSFSRPTDSVPT